MANRTCLPCLDPETIVPISRKTTAVFKTGSWTAVRPRFVEKTSPCRAACPAGNDIEAPTGHLSYTFGGTAAASVTIQVQE